MSALNKNLILLMLMIVATILGVVLKPSMDESLNSVNLEATIPKQFGDWVEVASPFVQVDLSTKRNGEKSTDTPYDDVLMRTYRNSQGKMVMLALAWGKNQRQEIKIHRPELCYVAQGYQVEQLTPTTFNGIKNTVAFPIYGKKMLAINSNSHRIDAVSYWIRIGNLYSKSAWNTRLHIIKEGLSGRTVDGILVRASTQLNTTDMNSNENSWNLLDKFLNDLLNHVDPNTRYLLVY